MVTPTVAWTPKTESRRAGRSRRRSAGSATWFGGTLLVIVGVLVAGPVLLLVYGSFTDQQIPNVLTVHGLGFANYREVFANSQFGDIALNTVIYVGGTALLGTAVAAGLAYLTERTDLPLKGLWYGLIIAGFAMPSIVQAIAWELLLDPHSGSLNNVLAAVWSPLGGLSVNNLAGMVFVQSVHTVPMGYVMFAPLMRNIDSSLEEAAVVAGARAWHRLRTVTGRLILPGALAVVIYQALSSLEGFEIPGILGLPNRVYVFSTFLYTEVHSASQLPSYNRASALGIALLVVAGVAIFGYFRVLNRASRFATLTGRGFRATPRRLGTWRPVAVLVMVAYVVVAMLLPFLMMLYTSLSRFAQPISARGLANLTTANYTWSVGGYDLKSVLLNTVYVVLGTALLTVVLSTCVSYVVVKSRFRFRRVLDVAAFVPHGVPGLVVGLAFFMIFLHIPALSSSLTAIVIAFSVGFMAYGTRATNASFLQVHSVIEESAATAGISHPRRVFGLVLPLVRPSLVGLFLLIVLMSSRVAGLPLMLFTGGSSANILSVVLWNLWNGGYLPAAAAIGTMLMVASFVFSILARRLSARQGGAM
jgi:iron(III) transport system permease protein